jgi:N-acyl amino acid synthase of PEP-CTERM/exosortase system
MSMHALREGMRSNSPIPFYGGNPLTSFEFHRITEGDPLLSELLALRYQVYCRERGFENPEDHLDGLEHDVYDAGAVHFAAVHSATQRVVGTVRLIVHSDRGFPVEHAFELNQNLSVNREHLGEISRLALSKEYCRAFKGRFRWQSEARGIIDGLIRCLAQEIRKQGLTHLYAVMARGLPILLARKKLFFSPIGPEKEYHGLRAPYIGTVRDILSKNPGLVLREPESEQRICAVA